MPALPETRSGPKVRSAVLILQVILTQPNAPPIRRVLSVMSLMTQTRRTRMTRMTRRSWSGIQAWRRRVVIAAASTGGGGGGNEDHDDDGVQDRPCQHFQVTPFALQQALLVAACRRGEPSAAC